MRSTTHSLLVITVLLLFTSLSCKKDPPVSLPQDPPTPTNCEYHPGNRNFTWRLDTVAWWPSTLGGVHAFSDSDAWVMGDMYGPVINGHNTSYVGLHWNGEAWKERISFLNLLVKANDVSGDDHFMVAAGYRLYSDTMGGAISKSAIAEFDNNSKQWKTFQFETIGELYSTWTDRKGFFIAVGANGIIYTKDGYTSDWVYQKAPTDFHFTKITGLTKNEMYSISQLPTVAGIVYQQYWKYFNGKWIKLYDNKDTTGTPVILNNTDNGMYDVGVSRCNVSDSLKIYMVGWESFLLESKGQSLEYKITNFSELGLPLRNLGRTAGRINVYSPNNYWVFGTRYNFYHWNGSNFQKIEIPGLPNDDAHFGNQQKMVKTLSGKLFLPTEISSEVYVVVQGTPN